MNHTTCLNIYILGTEYKFSSTLGFEKKRIDPEGKDAASRVVCADKRKRKPPKHLEQFEISSLENPAASKGDISKIEKIIYRSLCLELELVIE